MGNRISLEQGSHDVIFIVLDWILAKQNQICIRKKWKIRMVARQEAERRIWHYSTIPCKYYPQSFLGRSWGHLLYLLACDFTHPFPLLVDARTISLPHLHCLIKPCLYNTKHVLCLHLMSVEKCFQIHKCKMKGQCRQCTDAFCIHHDTHTHTCIAWFLFSVLLQGSTGNEISFQGSMLVVLALLSNCPFDCFTCNHAIPLLQHWLVQCHWWLIIASVPCSLDV